MTKDEMLEAIKGMNVLELSDLVKALEEEFGITAAGGYSPTPAKRALVFGGLLGLIILVTTATSAVVLTILTDLNPWLIWAPVVGFTFYTSSMGALGAMYSQLRAAQ